MPQKGNVNDELSKSLIGSFKSLWESTPGPSVKDFLDRLMNTPPAPASSASSTPGETSNQPGRATTAPAPAAGP